MGSIDFSWLMSVKNMNDGATPDFSHKNDQKSLRKIRDVG